jgi:hypothetical protein
MTDTDIHSCGYYCDRPACIKAQRNELRDKLFGEQWVKTYSGGKPNYTQPIEQEPVAVWELQEGGWDTIADAEWMETLPIGTKLYTAPPQREWQKLNAADMRELGISSIRLEMAKAIEAKLREKNA